MKTYLEEMDVLLPKLSDTQLVDAEVLLKAEIERRFAIARDEAAKASGRYAGLHHLFGRNPL